MRLGRRLSGPKDRDTRRSAREGRQPGGLMGLGFTGMWAGGSGSGLGWTWRGTESWGASFFPPGPPSPYRYWNAGPAGNYVRVAFVHLAFLPVHSRHAAPQRCSARPPHAEPVGRTSRGLRPFERQGGRELCETCLKVPQMHGGGGEPSPSTHIVSGPWLAVKAGHTSYTPCIEQGGPARPRRSSRLSPAECGSGACSSFQTG